jgi:hypothetical protein
LKENNIVSWLDLDHVVDAHLSKTSNNANALLILTGLGLNISVEIN